MKKFLSLLIVFALIISTVPAVFAADAETPIIYLEAITPEAAMQPGEEVEIEVLTSSRITSADWADMFSYQLVINFDNELLEAKSAESKLNDEEDETPGITNYVLDNEEGTLTLWFSKANGEGFSGSTLASLKFEVLETGSATVEIDEEESIFLTAGDIDVDADDLEFEVIFGYSRDELYKELELNLGAAPEKPKLLKNYASSFTSSLTIKFEDREDEALIYFTTDGSTPLVENIGKRSLKLYDFDEGIKITSTCTIKAIAVIGETASGIFSKKFMRATGGGQVGGGGGGGGGGSTSPITPITPTTPTTPSTSAPTVQKYGDITGHWANANIISLINKGIISGYEDGSVRPNNGVTRAEVAKIIVSALGKTPAKDVTLPFSDNTQIADWAKPYIKTAVELGILKGYEDNSFRATQNVTRQEMVVILARAFSITGGDAANLTFKDKASFQDWYKADLAAVVAKGVVNGYEDNTFRPTNGVTRAETCKMIDTLLK